MIGEVKAQWTIFDWHEYETCEEHWTVGASILWGKLIDGQPPVDVWLVRWDQELPWDGV